MLPRLIRKLRRGVWACSFARNLGNLAVLNAKSTNGQGVGDKTRLYCRRGIEPRIEMVLNFNLAPASFRTCSGRPEPHSGRDLDFFEGLDPGFREVRTANQRPGETARLAAGPGTCRGGGAWRLLPFFALLPSTCCQEDLHPAVCPPPQNVILWETHMAQPGEANRDSTGWTKAVPPSPAYHQPSARILRPWRCRISKRAGHAGKARPGIVWPPMHDEKNDIVSLQGTQN